MYISIYTIKIIKISQHNVSISIQNIYNTLVIICFKKSYPRRAKFIFKDNFLTIINTTIFILVV